MHIDFRNKYKIIFVLIVSACSSLSKKKEHTAKPQPVLPPKQIKKSLDPIKYKTQPSQQPKAPKIRKPGKPDQDELPNRKEDEF